MSIGTIIGSVVDSYLVPLLTIFIGFIIGSFAVEFYGFSWKRESIKLFIAKVTRSIKRELGEANAQAFNDLSTKILLEPEKIEVPKCNLPVGFDILGDHVNRNPQAVNVIPVNQVNTVPVNVVPANQANPVPVNAVNPVPVNAVNTVPVNAVNTVPVNAVNTVPVNAVNTVPVNAVNQVQVQQ
jgi:hypothetical protein